MYCNQCGKMVLEASKFCSNCGSPIPEGEKSNSIVENQTTYDAVKDLQKKLRAIDNRKKPEASKKDVIKSVIKVVKREASVFDLFEENFEEKKIADKKQLILDFPLPTSPEALASFAKYVNSEIVSKKREHDPLTDAWKEKLKQIYHSTEQKSKKTKEFAEIKDYYKGNKRRERRYEFRELVVFLLFPIILAFILSTVEQLPWLMFASIVALGWEIFLILYVYDLLDGMIASIKQHSAKHKNVPKLLRVTAWHLLVPVFAALIVSIVYNSVVLISLTATLFSVDAFFLLIFLVKKECSPNREFLWLLIFPTISIFVLSIIYHLPWLLFVAILALGWEFFIILFIYGLLDKVIDSIKRHSAKQKIVPKILRVVAWWLLIPALASLIVAITYRSEVFIGFTASFFGLDAFFLLFFLSYIYDYWT